MPEHISIVNRNKSKAYKISENLYSVAREMHHFHTKRKWGYAQSHYTEKAQ
jgi:hypothetical protein